MSRDRLVVTGILVDLVSLKWCAFTFACCGLEISLFLLAEAGELQRMQAHRLSLLLIQVGSYFGAAPNLSTFDCRQRTNYRDSFS